MKAFYLALSQKMKDATSQGDSQVLYKLADLLRIAFLPGDILMDSVTSERVITAFLELYEINSDTGPRFAYLDALKTVLK